MQTYSCLHRLHTVLTEVALCNYSRIKQPRKKFEISELKMLYLSRAARLLYVSTPSRYMSGKRFLTPLSPLGSSFVTSCYVNKKFNILHDAISIQQW